MALLREPGSGSRWSVDRIRAAGGPRSALIAVAGLFAEAAEQAAGGELARWRDDDIVVHGYCDDGYPPSLADAEHPPPLVFVRGGLEQGDLGGVSVIGTRHPTAAGLKAAVEVATTLVAAGRTVVSGLAAGIDTAAHTAALAAGGRSVAVLGNGLHHVYPASNGDLQRRLSAVVSQFWPEQRLDRSTFPQRNAVMSALSTATVIVEAGPRSGARIQARHALAQGRALFLRRSVLEQEWARAMAVSPGVTVIDDPGELPAALA